MSRLPAEYYEARGTLKTWLEDERIFYADQKYSEERLRQHRMDIRDLGLTDNSEAWVFITNYLKRAQLLSPETPQGRQAMGKLIVTLMSYLEISILEFGPMPKAGVPSGVIE